MSPSNDRQPVASSKKPVGLQITTALILTPVLLGTVRIIIGGVPRNAPWFAYILTPVLVATYLGFTWFYWKGYSWARITALIFCFSEVLDAVFSLTGFTAIRYLGAFANGEVLVNFQRVLLSGFIIAWLLSPEAVHYFSADARAERKSRAAFLKLTHSV